MGGALDRAAVLTGRVARGGLAWVAVASVLARVRNEAGVVTETAAAAWVADGLAVALSYLVESERPCRTGRALIECPESPSFPSNHAATAFAATTALMLRSRSTWPLSFAATAVAASRVRVGVHRPRDVVAGAVLGIATGVTMDRVWTKAGETPQDGTATSVDPDDLQPAADEA